MKRASLRNLWSALRQDERGETAVFGMLVTFASAVLVGLALFAFGLGNSFHAVGALLASVAAGL